MALNHDFGWLPGFSSQSTAAIFSPFSYSSDVVAKIVQIDV